MGNFVNLSQCNGESVLWVGTIALDHTPKIVFPEVKTQNSRKPSPTLLESET